MPRLGQFLCLGMKKSISTNRSFSLLVTSPLGEIAQSQLQQTFSKP